MKFEAIYKTNYRVVIEADDAADANAKALALIDEPGSKPGETPHALWEKRVPGSEGYSVEFVGVVQPLLF